MMEFYVEQAPMRQEEKSVQASMENGWLGIKGGACIEGDEFQSMAAIVSV